MFTVALSNVLITLLYAVPAFILCKIKKAAANHLPTLSAVLVYICSPCMIVSAFLGMDFSLKGLGEMGLFFVASLVLQILFMLILWLIFRKKYEESKYRVLTIGAVMGNVGFFGLPIVRALFPNNPEAVCYSVMYVVSMNVLVFTVGVFCLTRNKKYMSVKQALLNPSTVSAVLAIPLYIFGVGTRFSGTKLHLLFDAVDLLGKATTPLCMIILGIRLATVRFRSLFTRPVVYLTCACKLLLFPLFCYLAVVFLPLPVSFKASMLILSAAPCASVILNMAEMHESETELAANVVLLSTTLCFLTIPLLSLLL